MDEIMPKSGQGSCQSASFILLALWRDKSQTPFTDTLLCFHIIAFGYKTEKWLLTFSPDGQDSSS